MKKSNKKIILRVCGKLDQKVYLDTNFKEHAPENFCEIHIGGLFFCVSWTDKQADLSVMNGKYKTLISKKFRIKKQDPLYDLSTFQISDLAKHMDDKRQAEAELFQSSFNAVVIKPKQKRKI